MNTTRSCSGKRPSPFRETALTLAAGAIVALFVAALVGADYRYFWHDDFQSNYLPGFAEMDRSWRQGELPLISSLSWMGGALGAEYQYGVFSVFVTLCVALVFQAGLSLPMMAALLSGIHLVVLATGTFRLGRARGLSFDLALLATLVTSVNGWLFVWAGMNWFPALASFAWLPWAWWSLEHSLDPARGPARFVPAAIFLYLLISAGWPFTVLMSGAVTAWVLARAWCGGTPLASLWPVLASWAAGLGLSAPAWMMLLEYSPHTVRSLNPLQLVWDWVVPLGSLPGLIFPPHTVTWRTFSVTKPHVSSELTGGMVPLIVLASCLWPRARELARALRWELLLCMAALLLALSPGVGNFRWSFRWLPLFFLALGLAAAKAQAQLQEQALARNRGLWCATLVTLVWLPTLWTGIAPAVLVSSQAVFLLGLSALWALIEARAPAGSALRLGMPCVLHLVACWSVLNEGPRFLEVPTWRLEEELGPHGPLDPRIRYLAVYSRHDIHDGQQPRGAAFHPGNSAMYCGIEHINGYSPLGPTAVTRAFDMGIHGYLGEAAAERVLTGELGPEGLLQRMAVDGLVVADRFAVHFPRLAAAGWTEVASLEGGRVFHREGPASPRVRVIGGAGRLILRHESPRRVEVEIETDSLDTNPVVLFSRAWYPGYRATFEGRPVPLIEGMMPTVSLPPPRRGTLVLEYQPASLDRGRNLAGGTLILLAGVGLASMLGARRRRDGRAG